MRVGRWCVLLEAETGRELNMTNEEINRTIAERMGHCVHSSVTYRTEDGGPGIDTLHVPYCDACKQITDVGAAPDYTDSLDAVSKAEAWAIEKVGREMYANALVDVAKDSIPLVARSIMSDDDAFLSILEMCLSADARTRALAIIRATETVTDGEAQNSGHTK